MEKILRPTLKQVEKANELGVEFDRHTVTRQMLAALINRAVKSQPTEKKRSASNGGLRRMENIRRDE